MDELKLPAEIKLRFSNLPVMVVTAYWDEECRRRASEHRAAEFFADPADFDCLKALPGRVEATTLPPLGALSTERQKSPA
jgi:response regulator RpfG family c-di-GMP phosphodiesterase